MSRNFSGLIWTLAFLLSSRVSAESTDLHEYLTRKNGLAYIMEKFTKSLKIQLDARSPKNDLIFIIENHLYEDFGSEGFGPSFNSRQSGFLNLINARIFSGYADISYILNNFYWTSSTLFAVISERNEDDDRFYLESLQDPHAEKIVKAFGKDLIHHGRKRLRAKREIKASLETFWNKKIFNAIVAKPTKSRVYVYSYFPYTPTNCIERLVPVLMDVWIVETSSFFFNHDLFPKKNKRLWGCPLNVSVVVNPPAIIPQYRYLDGIEGRILMKIFMYLNATPNFKFIYPSRNAKAMENALSDVSKGFSDIGAGFLIPTKSHLGNTDDIYIPINLCLTWAGPNRVMVKNFVVYIFEAFNFKVWLCVIVSVAISILSFRLMQRVTIRDIDPMGYASVKIISAFIGLPGTPPSETQLKVFLIFCTCFSIFLTNAFQAGLGSNKIIIQPRTQVDTIKDILKSGLKIKGLNHAINMIDGAISKMNVRGKNIDIAGEEEMLLLVGIERHTLVIGYKPTMKYYKNLLFPNLRGLVHIHKTCIVNFIPFIALKKNSPFSHEVNKLVTVMTENGIVTKLLKHFTMYNGELKIRKERMDYDMILFYGALQIWSYGMGASIAVFLFEYFYHNYKKRNRQKKLFKEGSKKIQNKNLK